MLHNNEHIIKYKVELLNYAEKLGNVSKASQVMGLSRDTFYSCKQAVDESGVDALFNKSRRKENPPNRVDEKIEHAAVMHAMKYPAYGQVRASNELRKQGVFVFTGHFDRDSARRHIIKSACIQARKHLSHKAFVELNKCFVDALYASKIKTLKRWHGHRVCAVDGSQLRLPREVVLKKRSVDNLQFPVKPSRLWDWLPCIMMFSISLSSMPSWLRPGNRNATVPPSTWQRRKRRT